MNVKVKVGYILSYKMTDNKKGFNETDRKIMMISSTVRALLIYFIIIALHNFFTVNPMSDVKIC